MTKNELKKLIGQRIKTLRKQKGLTQEKLAEKMNITPQYLGNIERGVGNPALNTIIGLSEALESSLDDIFSLLETEDAKKAKQLMRANINKANDDQIKTLSKITSIITR